VKTGLDAAFEMLCAGALVWLLYVGIEERKGYRDISRRIRLGDHGDSDTA
jgi:hypothetical protein